MAARGTGPGAGTGPAADAVGRAVRVLCWSERTEPPAVYPEGINGAIALALEEANDGREAPGLPPPAAGAPGFEVRPANLADPGQGLDDLDWADVLVWFGHLKHNEVTAANVQRIVDAVWQRGLGYVPLHSSIDSHPFHRVLGHRGRIAGWREDGYPSVVSVVQPDHPIAAGIDRTFVIPMEEMYSEPFAIKPPDELVFLSSFAGGEVLRSGCCWYAGAGRVFYFQPGHETYPVYFQPEIKRIVANACRWAAARTADVGTGSWWRPGEA